MQAPRRGGLSHRRRVETRGAGEVDPARASVDAAPVVGAPAAGLEPRGATGAAAAGPVRPALPGGVQAAGDRGPGRRAPAAGERRGTAPGAAVVHRGVRQLGHGRAPDLPAGGAQPGPGRPRRRSAAGGGPIRGRRVDSAGGATAGLRGVRERPEPGGMPDSQGHAGGHPAARAGAGRRAPPGGRRDQDGGRARAGGPLPPGPRRRDAHRLSLGAHRALRGTELRGRDSAAAVAVAVQEGWAQACVAAPRGAERGRAAAGRVRDRRTGRRPGGARRDRGPSQGGLRLLRLGAAAGTGAGAARGRARGRGCRLRR